MADVRIATEPLRCMLDEASEVMQKYLSVKGKVGRYEKKCKIGLLGQGLLFRKPGYPGAAKNPEIGAVDTRMIPVCPRGVDRWSPLSSRVSESGEWTPFFFSSELGRDRNLEIKTSRTDGRHQSSKEEAEKRSTYVKAECRGGQYQLHKLLFVKKDITGR